MKRHFCETTTIKSWVYKQGQSMGIRATAGLKNNACLCLVRQHKKWRRESGRPPTLAPLMSRGTERTVIVIPLGYNGQQWEGSVKKCETSE